MVVRTAFVLVILFSLLVHPQNSSSAEFPHGIPGVIFAADETEAMARRLAAPDLKGPFWSPTVEQVLMLERNLPEAIRKQDFQVMKRDLILYKRQYFGITEGGSKKIYANFFCEQYWKYNDDWRSKIVVSRQYVRDCYFVWNYDPSTKEFSDLLKR